MGRSISNHKSIRVDRVEQGGIVSRTGSNHGSKRVKSWVNRVETWVEQGQNMSQTGSNHESNRVRS